MTKDNPVLVIDELRKLGFIYEMKRYNNKTQKYTVKDFVLYAGLQYLAHKQGFKGTETDVLQFPNPENAWTCIVKSKIKLSKGDFEAIGDASPVDNELLGLKASVSGMIAPHYIRMAETRAKARALRDALNIGLTCFEELGSLDSSSDEEGFDSQLTNKPQGKKKGKAKGEFESEMGKRLKALRVEVNKIFKLKPDPKTKSFIKQKLKDHLGVSGFPESDEQIEQLGITALQIDKLEDSIKQIGETANA